MSNASEIKAHLRKLYGGSDAVKNMYRTRKYLEEKAQKSPYYQTTLDHVNEYMIHVEDIIEKLAHITAMATINAEMATILYEYPANKEATDKAIQEAIMEEVAEELPPEYQEQYRKMIENERKQKEDAKTKEENWEFPD